MPAAALGDLLDALRDVLLDTVGPAVTDVEVQVTGRRNFNPTVPSIDIYPGDPFRDKLTSTAGFSDDQGDLILTVRARVSTVDNQGGQDLLLRLMDDHDDIGVAGTLEEDQTLNGLASSVSVEGNSGYLSYIEGGSESGAALLGCEWRVRVLRAVS